MAVELLLDSVMQDLLGVALLLGVFLFFYMKSKHKTFKEVMDDVKGGFS